MKDMKLKDLKTNYFGKYSDIRDVNIRGALITGC
jgi:hypothetical protein